jgi:hypothetical protein
VAAARAAAATAGAAVTGVPVAQTGAFEVFVSTGAGGGAAATAPALAWSKLATGQPAGVEGVGAVVEAVLAEVRRKGRAASDAVSSDAVSIDGGMDTETPSLVEEKKHGG